MLSRRSSGSTSCRPVSAIPVRFVLSSSTPRARQPRWAGLAMHAIGGPMFVKPTTGRKEFTGFVLKRTDDLLRVTNVDDELPVFVGRPVDLRTRVEWRAFVIDGQVRDIRPYTGRADGDAPSL